MIKFLISKMLMLKQRICNYYYRKIFGKCGKNLLIYGKPRIIYGKNITIGNNVNINDGVMLNATCSNIEIGSNVTISTDAKILAASYDKERFIMTGERKHIGGGITIGNNVWICANVIV